MKKGFWSWCFKSLIRMIKDLTSNWHDPFKEYMLGAFILGVGIVLGVLISAFYLLFFFLAFVLMLHGYYREFVKIRKTGD